MRVARLNKLTESSASLAARLIPTVASLRHQAIALEHGHLDAIDAVPESHRHSARNLLHYLSLRQQDLRELQDSLTLLGLSRLARTEAHALGSLDAVLRALHAIAGEAMPYAEDGEGGGEGAGIGFQAGDGLLREHAADILGPSRGPYATRIMVTLPSEAASQPQLLKDLLEHGMDIARINCGHDGPETWVAMIRNLRLAEAATGRRCKICADLSGPKLRTGIIEPIGRLVEFKTQRDAWGRVTSPARIWLTPAGGPRSGRPCCAAWRCPN